jgi:5-methylcytosine-specific restriction endonuclease McrA
MDEATKLRVRVRAEYRCEYCGTRQVDEPFFAYQVEHIIAKQHGGSDEDANLALACSHCNLHKGPNLAGIDPITKLLSPLFHPRRQTWDEHFANR